MTRDEVLALAREVGLWEMLEGYSSEYGSLDAEEDCLPTLERFAALVAAHERERILEMCKEGWWDGEGIRYHLENKTLSGAGHDKR